MTEVFIEAPENWIALPADGADQAAVFAWAKATIDDLRPEPESPIEPERREQVALVLTALAERARQSDASATYVALSDWAGPVFVAEARLLPATIVGGRSPEQLVTAADGLVADEPVVEPFLSASGAEGVRSTTFSVSGEVEGALLGQIAYAWSVPDGSMLVILFSSSDLVDVQKAIPLVELLAAGVVLRTP